LIYR